MHQLPHTSEVTTYISTICWYSHACNQKQQDYGQVNLLARIHAQNVPTNAKTWLAGSPLSCSFSN